MPPNPAALALGALLPQQHIHPLQHLHGLVSSDPAGRDHADAAAAAADDDDADDDPRYGGFNGVLIPGLTGISKPSPTMLSDHPPVLNAAPTAASPIINTVLPTSTPTFARPAVLVPMKPATISPRGNSLAAGQYATIDSRKPALPHSPGSQPPSPVVHAPASHPNLQPQQPQQPQLQPHPQPQSQIPRDIRPPLPPPAQDRTVSFADSILDDVLAPLAASTAAPPPPAVPTIAADDRPDLVPVSDSEPESTLDRSHADTMRSAITSSSGWGSTLARAQDSHRLGRKSAVEFSPFFHSNAQLDPDADASVLKHSLERVLRASATIHSATSGSFLSDSDAGSFLSDDRAATASPPIPYPPGAGLALGAGSASGVHPALTADRVSVTSIEIDLDRVAAANELASTLEASSRWHASNSDVATQIKLNQPLQRDL